MAESDGKVKFEAEFDFDKAKAAIESFRSSLEKIGAGSESLNGVLNGFLRMAGPIAAAGAAIYAFKKAFDLTLEGEHILKIQDQFNRLAEDAGLNSDEIAKGLEKATKGTVDMTEAMESANKAIIQLGPSADRIPQMFDVARRAAKAYGKDTTEVFDGIALAAQTGNARYLKQVGLYFDAEKALLQYAKANNTTVGALSEFGKQQAFINKLLETGNSKFKDGGDKSLSLGQSLKVFSTQLKDFSDQIAVAFNKLFGPAFTKVVEFFSDKLKVINQEMTASFGTGAAKTEAQFASLERQIASLERKMKNARDQFDGKIPNLPAYKMMNAELARATQELNMMKLASEDAQMAEASRLAEKAAADKAAGKKGPSKEDENNALAEQLKFKQMLMAADIETQNISKQLTTDEEEYRDILKLEELDIVEQINLQKQQLKTQIGKGITEKQYLEMVSELEDQKQAKIMQHQQQQAEQMKTLYEQQIKYSKSLMEGFTAQAKLQSQQLNDTGQQGVKMYNAVEQGSVKFFKSIGTGAKSAGDAMKEFLLGALGEYVSMKGEALIAEGIAMLASYQPNGAVLVAEGGALIALGAAIGAAGGGSGGSASGGGGGGASSGSQPSFAPGADTSSPALQQANKKTVSITVQGNMFNTSETQRAIVDMIKAENDATDYKFTQIGVR